MSHHVDSKFPSSPPLLAFWYKFNIKVIVICLIRHFIIYDRCSRLILRIVWLFVVLGSTPCKKQAKEKNNEKNLDYSFHKDTDFLNSFLTKFHGASASDRKSTR